MLKANYEFVSRKTTQSHDKRWSDNHLFFAQNSDQTRNDIGREIWLHSVVLSSECLSKQKSI